MHNINKSKKSIFIAISESKLRNTRRISITEMSELFEKSFVPSTVFACSNLDYSFGNVLPRPVFRKGN